jgi:hypothetical protein
MDLNTIQEAAKRHELPVEDVLFIAINLSGVDFDCEYNTGGERSVPLDTSVGGYGLL